MYMFYDTFFTSKNFNFRSKSEIFNVAVVSFLFNSFVHLYLYYFKKCHILHIV